MSWKYLLCILAIASFIGVILFFKIDTSKKKYNFSLEPIDVVIPCIKSDMSTLDLAIAGIRENGHNIRNVFIVSSEPFTKNALWIDEAIFPFTKASVANAIFDGDSEQANKYINHKKTRIGWIYQQLLKLYAPFVIPGISENVLIVDADTIFLNPVRFQTSSGAAFFNPGTEHHKPYFEHAKKLIPGFRRVYSQHSGIAHHMLFQRSVLEDLFNEIRNLHNVEPWVALVQQIDKQQLWVSALSEYEIYFNFVFERNSNVKIRHLKWDNSGDLDSLQTFKKQGCHYVSFHHYLRGRKWRQDQRFVKRLYRFLARQGRSLLAGIIGVNK